MEQRYDVIDMKNWKRAQHCQLFRNSMEPQYCVSFDLDITNFISVVHDKKYSLTFALIYAIAYCANEIEEFRYRFMGEHIILYKQIDTAFTYLHDNTGLFKFVQAPMQSSMTAYVDETRKITNAQRSYFTSPPKNDVFIFSPMPWVSFRHISHTISGKKDNAVPLFDWGKYYYQNNKVLLPFAVQVHHSFVDGIHIGRLAHRLQQYMDSIT
jgi:chloramphenicol O-acetyltransferase type A